MITFLDYGAGNVRSVINALESLGEKVRIVTNAREIASAERLVFPGVGNFGSVMQVLDEKKLIEPLQEYLRSNRPFLGICIGLQALFEESEEAPGVRGLGFIPGTVKRFVTDLSVPHIGWNGVKIREPSRLFNGLRGDEKFYFVHSYHVVPKEDVDVLTTTDYGCAFVSSIQRGNVIATQFHPEKSGEAGLRILKNFLETHAEEASPIHVSEETRLAKRIIACLDVRSNDQGDLVVTKGDQYDVREEGIVRNLGKPVELARRYYQEGADEITFLNITGFRDFPLEDMPMIEVLKQTSENVFVPLTIGGGIRDYTDKDGREYTALEVAAEYFRSGADKVSIGSDAVLIVEEYLKTGRKTGRSAIEEISRVYGNQAVVISIDPRRVYVESPGDVKHQVIETTIPGPQGGAILLVSVHDQGRPRGQGSRRHDPGKGLRGTGRGRDPAELYRPGRDQPGVRHRTHQWGEEGRYHSGHRVERCRVCRTLLRRLHQDRGRIRSGRRHLPQGRSPDLGCEGVPEGQG